MTLYQIQYFRAVCMTGSVTEAAREMNVSQPVISAAIKSLETEFQVLLFHRYKRKLNLTREGEKLFRLSEEIVTEKNALEKRMQELRTENRPVHVGVSPMVGGIYFPRLIREFKKDHPEIEVVMEERRSVHMLEWIRKESIDLAFALIKHNEPEDISACLLKQTQFELAVHGGHPLAGRDRILPEDLNGLPLVVYKDSSSLMKQFREAGAEPELFMNVDQIYTMKSYAAGGVAATILLEDMIRMENELRGIPFQPEMKADVGILWKRDHHLHSNAMILMEYAKEFFREGGGGT